MGSIAYLLNGYPITTKKLVSTNVSQTLPTAYMGATANYIQETVDNRVLTAAAVIISVEDNDIRYAIGMGTANNSSSLNGHILAAGDPPLRLTNPELIRTFNFCAKTAGSYSNVMVSAEYF